MCGITGIYSSNLDKLEILQSLQHRGQDSYGYSNGFLIEKKMGLVQPSSKEMIGKCIIGHTRYRTSGNVSLEECQPLQKNGITLVHNGNIDNGRFFNKNDTFYFLEKLERNIKLEETIIDAIAKTVNEVNGAYFIIFIYRGEIYAFKDRYGIRPGGYWIENNNNKIVASERVGGIYTDIYPGEIVILGKELRKIKFAQYQISPCIFEYIYFAHLDSTIYGVKVYDFRVRLGKSSAELLTPSHLRSEIDIVLGIPKTATVYGKTIASELGIPYYELIRNQTKRSFIMPTQKEREEYVKKKFSFPPEVFKKSVLVVDDSIVRGTISKHIVRELRRGGVKYICFLSCSPKIVRRNTYGINISSEKELISYGKSHDEICKEIGVDDLVYQTIPNLYRASGFPSLELSIFTNH